MHRRVLVAACLLLTAWCVPGRAAGQNAASEMNADDERAQMHDTPEWTDLAAHLPSPQSATAAQLETAGDVLRARRFPEDALEYYGYALKRGGKVSVLLNKMGIVQMELRQYDTAHELFLRVVKTDKRNAQAWNNLGATEFLRKRYTDAEADYHKAIALDKKSAILHSNLGLAYFESDKMEDARMEFARAVQIDPKLLQQQDDGGLEAHVMASENYPKLCFEFARMFAQRGDAVNLRLWLGKAGEAGYDIEHAMTDDPVLRPYAKDPELQMVLANARELRVRKLAVAKNVPSLGVAPH